MNPNQPSAGQVTLSLSIRGRVQGVGYRWSMCETAQALGLSGWVRNRRDGSVEALAHGPKAAVSALVDWARHGPAGAHVVSVEVRAVDSEGGLGDFKQMPTV